MDEVKEKMFERSAKNAVLKEYESKLAGVLAKIRNESLSKLRLYKNGHEQIKALLEEFEQEWYVCEADGEGIEAATGGLIRRIKSVLSTTEKQEDYPEEIPDDGSGHDMPSGPVDQPQRANAGTDGSTDCSTGESDGQGG